MKERPILFNGEMVRAILDGRKTMTRRPIKRINNFVAILTPEEAIITAQEALTRYPILAYRALAKCPYGQPGDRLWVTQGATPNSVLPFEERFWSRVYKFDDCWEWFGSTNRKRYGTIRWNKKSWSVHRASWVLHEGEIPNGLHVLHKCDTPWCVNPDHLYLGTNDDNIADKVSRGREPHLFGEWNGQSKLTLDEVQSIHDLYWEQDVYQKDIAQQYNISQSQVSRIVNGKRWINYQERLNRNSQSWGHRNLEVTGVRVERVQDINEKDARAEGVERAFTEWVVGMTKPLDEYGWNNYLWHGHKDVTGPMEDAWPHQFSNYQDARGSFSSLWEKINARRGFGWDANPWVWVVEFRIM